MTYSESQLRYFLSKVPAEQDQFGCRLWQGMTYARRPAHSRYGKLLFAPWYSHRMAFDVFVGSLTPGLVVMHACDRILCCEPSHLTEGTHAENMQDMAAKGRQRVGPRLAKLEDGQLATVALQLAAGRTKHSLAREYLVHRKTISRRLRALASAEAAPALIL